MCLVMTIMHNDKHAADDDNHVDGDPDGNGDVVTTMTIMSIILMTWRPAPQQPWHLSNSRHASTDLPAPPHNMSGRSVRALAWPFSSLAKMARARCSIKEWGKMSFILQHTPVAILV